MDQLKQLIMYKLKFIQTYRNRTPVSLQQKQKIIELFLKQKRKQNSRDVIESRLLQTIFTRRIEAPYRIQQFFNQSVQMMKIYNPEFQYVPAKERDGKDNGSVKDPITNIVRLYIQFFNRNQCSKRAQQIQHIFKKSLCEKGMLIPTIFNWFVEWLKKIFKQFIKSMLHTLNNTSNPRNNSSVLIQQDKKLRNKKFMEQISIQKASLSIIDTQIRQHKQLQLNLKLTGNKSKLLTPHPYLHQYHSNSHHRNYNQIKSSRNQLSSQLNNQSLSYRNQSMSLIRLKTNNQIDFPSNMNNSVSNSNQTTIQPQKQQIRDKSITNLNKDIFFSAFYQQFNNYYKFYSTVIELDDGFPRNFRKIDRRQEITKNINVLVRSMVRSQPNQIRNSIQSYCISYNKFNKIYPNSIKQLNMNINYRDVKKSKKNSTKRAQSGDLSKKVSRQHSPQKQKQKNQQDCSPQLPTNLSIELKLKKQRSQTHRIEAQKKKIQLELPQIKPFKSVQKIIIVNQGQISLINNRYNNQNKDKDREKAQSQRQRVSAELYKQLRQISSLFRNRKGLRKQPVSFIERVSNDQRQRQRDRISPIIYKNDNSQISELLDGHFQADGIFRLPKIKK